MPVNLLKKKDDELEEMKRAGLDMLYVGIESGSDIVSRKLQRARPTG
jgi:radical SAM superfamily enzyme YgiQ (UPF0313 family)